MACPVTVGASSKNCQNKWAVHASRGHRAGFQSFSWRFWPASCVSLSLTFQAVPQLSKDVLCVHTDAIQWPCLAGHHSAHHCQPPSRCSQEGLVQAAVAQCHRESPGTRLLPGVGVWCTAAPQVQSGKCHDKGGRKRFALKKVSMQVLLMTFIIDYFKHYFR